MSIREAILKFLESREMDNCSDKGIRTYRERLGYFVVWLELTHNIVDLKDLQLDHLYTGTRKVDRSMR